MANLKALNRKLLHSQNLAPDANQPTPKRFRKFRNSLLLQDPSLLANGFIENSAGDAQEEDNNNYPELSLSSLTRGRIPDTFEIEEDSLTCHSPSNLAEVPTIECGSGPNPPSTTDNNGSHNIDHIDTVSGSQAPDDTMVMIGSPRVMNTAGLVIDQMESSKDGDTKVTRDASPQPPPLPPRRYKGGSGSKESSSSNKLAVYPRQNSSKRQSGTSFDSMETFAGTQEDGATTAAAGGGEPWHHTRNSVAITNDKGSDGPPLIERTRSGLKASKITSQHVYSNVDVNNLPGINVDTGQPDLSSDQFNLQPANDEGSGDIHDGRNTSSIISETNVITQSLDSAISDHIERSLQQFDSENGSGDHRSSVSINSTQPEEGIQRDTTPLTSGSIATSLQADLKPIESVDTPPTAGLDVVDGGGIRRHSKGSRRVLELDEVIGGRRHPIPVYNITTSLTSQSTATGGEASSVGGASTDSTRTQRSNSFSARQAAGMDDTNNSGKSFTAPSNKPGHLMLHFKNFYALCAHEGKVIVVGY